MKFSVLLIGDDKAHLIELSNLVERLGHSASVASSPNEMFELVRNQKNIDVIIADTDSLGSETANVMRKIRKQCNFKRWVLWGKNIAIEAVRETTLIGPIDTLAKPATLMSLEALFTRCRDKIHNPLLEIMDIVQGITGIQLGREKQLLVETRLMRRIRILGIPTIDDYIIYFNKNRESELDDLVTLVSTHTTQFFREFPHFDYLFDTVFPSLLERKEPIKVWSAACSSGEECYSIAISWLEFLKKRGIPHAAAPSFEVFGTDISVEQVKIAERGIYPANSVTRINPNLVSQYFDIGRDQLTGWVRVKDAIHNLCRFSVGNLQADKYPDHKFDLIFIRNVLIYFNADGIKKIMKSMERVCKQDTYMFLGHSETLAQLNTGFEMIGNSIYRLKTKVRSDAAMNPANSLRMKKVFIVDDSETIRKMLKMVLVPQFGFEVIGEAANPIEAEKKLANIKPDIMTLDIHMPEMDGVTYLESLKTKPKNFPIVVLSSMSYEDAVGGLRCFEAGAVDFIEKPQGLDLSSDGERIRAILSAAIGSKFKQMNVQSIKGSKEVVERDPNRSLILIGASTGGVEAIMSVLKSFPKNSPPILIVQHMPPVFSKAFAKRLSDCCQVSVVEGFTGARLLPGKAYLAPGGTQMGIVRGAGGLEVIVNDEPPVNRHKPSVDYLFQSALKCKVTENFNTVAVLLTGMGADGAKGLSDIKSAGGHTIAQNEETCVVFGMPGEAIKLGGATEVQPLQSIAYHIFKVVNQNNKIRPAA